MVSYLNFRMLETTVHINVLFDPRKKNKNKTKVPIGVDYLL